jgi:hypothetical protein
MKRQFFALGLAASAIGGFAIMQPALALNETENNTVRAQDITSQSSTGGATMQGQVRKSGNFSQNDPVDMFSITVPAGKQLTVGGVPGLHPNNVIIKLVEDRNNNLASDREDRNVGFVAPGVVRRNNVAPFSQKYLVHVTLDDPRADVPNTAYGFTWSVR